MKARMLFNYDWDWAGTEASLKRAIDLSPGFPFAYEAYCWLLLAHGRRDEALAAARKTVTLDPRSSYMVFTEGRVLRRVRRYREAEATYRRAIDLDPGFPMPLLDAGPSLHDRVAVRRGAGDPGASRPAAIRTRGSSDGRIARSRIRQQGAGAGAAKMGAPTLRARVLLALGDYDAAFGALDEAIEARTFNAALLSIRTSTAFDRIRASRAPSSAWGSPPVR